MSEGICEREGPPSAGERRSQTAGLQLRTGWSVLMLEKICVSLCFPGARYTVTSPVASRRRVLPSHVMSYRRVVPSRRAIARRVVCFSMDLGSGCVCRCPSRRAAVHRVARRPLRRTVVASRRVVASHRVVPSSRTVPSYCRVVPPYRRVLPSYCRVVPCRVVLSRRTVAYVVPSRRTVAYVEPSRRTVAIRAVTLIS